MRSQQLLSVLVRAFGLYEFLRCVGNCLYAAAHYVALPISPKETFSEDVFWAVFDVAVAAICIWGADGIARLVHTLSGKQEDSVVDRF